MLKLVYFDGCPNAPAIIAQLREIGAEFEIIDQNSLPPGDPLRMYSSPTLLQDDRIIVGSEVDGNGGCSFRVPSSTEDLAELLR